MRKPVHADAHDTALSLRDEIHLIEQLQKLKSRRSPRQPRITKLTEILERTPSSRVRNAAALALADMRALGARDILIDLLRRPETKGSRGTLLYALERLGVDVPLAVLADVIVEDSYEAREEAMALIARDRIECSAADFAGAQVKLEAAHLSADSERSQAIRRALELLRTRHY